MEEKEFLRSIVSTPECEDFMKGLNEKASKKLEYLINKISNQQILSKDVVTKLVNTKFYELRIKVGNQYRIIMFAIDHDNFNECTEVFFLNGFHKKATKDYPKAIKRAQKLLTEYQDEINLKEDEEE